MTDTLHTPECNSTEEPIAFDARTRRVLELRKQVREGSYRPDPQQIAVAILNEWLATPELSANDEAAPSIDSAEGRRTIGARFVVARSEPEEEATIATRTA